jgi:hypothetical protein
MFDDRNIWTQQTGNRVANPIIAAIRVADTDH